MSSSPVRLRALAGLMLAVAALVAACTPPPTTTTTGIKFTAPNIGYVGKTFTPTATANNGLPVNLALDPTSTGCTFDGSVVSFTAPGKCVIVASQTATDTVAAYPTVKRTITVYNCPPLKSGLWTGPLNLSANVVVDPGGSLFSGTVDLSSLGYGVQNFTGAIACEVVTMTWFGTPLRGTLSPSGSTLTTSYNGASIVLNAPK